jgi:acyl-CoA-binding protein
MADLDADFKKAQDDLKTLTERPSNEDLLQIYGLFKQATAGDVEGKRPGMLDVKGRAKYDAWASLKGKSSDEAKKAYIAKVKAMLGKYSHS